jgi:hypothetical protein
MSIPYSQFRDAPAMAAVNAEFKAREDALPKTKRKSIT